MLSKELVELYYKHYMDGILKFYINNFGTVSWHTPKELKVETSPKRIPWDKKYTDEFIINSANDKTLLGKDILKRGMYFPFFTVNNFVVLGYHRLYSLKLIDTDKEFLCISLNKNHIRENLKYNSKKELEHKFSIEIPTNFKPLEDSWGEEYQILNNNKIKIDDVFTLVDVNTYNDLIDVVKIIPHWIKNYFIEYDINPPDILNDRTAFNNWMAK